MTLEQIWNLKQFTFETLPAFKNIDTILTTLEEPITDDSTFIEGDQLFKLTVGNLEAEAGYYYIDDAYVSVHVSVYEALNHNTQDYELLDRCAEPLDIYPGITLDDIQEQLFGYLYEFENDLIVQLY